MTLGGWILMTLCVGGVTIFFFTTLFLVITNASGNGKAKSNPNK